MYMYLYIGSTFESVFTVTVYILVGVSTVDTVFTVFSLKHVSVCVSCNLRFAFLAIDICVKQDLHY